MFTLKIKIALLCLLLAEFTWVIVCFLNYPKTEPFCFDCNKTYEEAQKQGELNYKKFQGQIPWGAAIINSSWDYYDFVSPPVIYDYKNDPAGIKVLDKSECVWTNKTITQIYHNWVRDCQLFILLIGLSILAVLFMEKLRLSGILLVCCLPILSMGNVSDFFFRKTPMYLPFFLAPVGLYGIYHLIKYLHLRSIEQNWKQSTIFISIGAGLLFIGLAGTIGTIAAAVHNGGIYVVFIAPIIVGARLLGKGIKMKN